jgi:hypothetical protein
MSDLEELHYQLSVLKSERGSEARKAELVLQNFDRTLAVLESLHQLIESFQKLSDLPDSRRVLDLIKSNLEQLIKESEK